MTNSAPQGTGRRLEEGIAWAVRNADGIVAIVVALVVGLMDVLNQNMDANVVSGATLLVLAALVYGGLTERRRRMADLRAASAGTSRAIEDLAMVRTLSGAEVALAHERARRTTSRWVFKGGTGTYLRAVTLPECVLEAQRQRRFLTVKIDIINPADEQVCAAYARFRSTFGPGPGDAEWTVERTRKEAYATVVAAGWHRQRLDTLEIDVHLSSVAPALRFDLSDSCLIITQDDPSRVSLYVERDRPLYDYYVTELHQSREQAVKLDLREAVPLADEPTVDEVRRLLDRLGLPLPPSFTDGDVGDIIDKALRAENPYRR
ncbi:hypothetical protein ABB07_10700 [Streptomyces incarnatus]|uniref:Uncharacterized protein n=1 Tax=Streptomyces incarnatus TaxID=665007 RepID=A0ABM5THQ5_9ACTN|nr:hypothetical protein [Streptomyces incarnatus]AKJ10470.1 hypothetical protein ABB07_10700 [Streptomyces incarnatus]